MVHTRIDRVKRIIVQKIVEENQTGEDDLFESISYRRALVIETTDGYVTLTFEAEEGSALAFTEPSVANDADWLTPKQRHGTEVAGGEEEDDDETAS